MCENKRVSTNNQLTDYDIFFSQNSRKANKKQEYNEKTF